MTVPRRRGTGPKARLREFLAAFDRWHNYDCEPFSENVDRTEQRHRELRDAMIEARQQITGTIGIDQRDIDNTREPVR